MPTTELIKQIDFLENWSRLGPLDLLSIRERREFSRALMLGAVEQYISETHPSPPQSFFGSYEWPRELDSISRKYGLMVPQDDGSYAGKWFAAWHQHREMAVDRLIENHLVWC